MSKIDRLPFARTPHRRAVRPLHQARFAGRRRRRDARGGEVEICKGYGLASLEHGVPIRPETRFRIASVSKQFTVTTALMLAAEGKLKLSDPPHKYLRELPSRCRSPSTR